MSENAELRTKVTQKVDVLIRATEPGINLEEPFYAINWFSTKVEWLYHLYNFLAIRSVKKIGGVAFFKGKVRETLLDDANGRRDLLLIVKYPSGQNFLSLMSSTYFKIVSIFRILSVSKFTFGFTHKMETDSAPTKKGELFYAIHHFKSKIEIKDTLKEINQNLPNGISIKYAGRIIANLNSQKEGSEVEQIPNLMDAVIIFQARDENNLRNIFSTNVYKNILNTLESSHVSLLDRISV